MAPWRMRAAASGGCSCPTLISRWPRGSFLLQVGQRPLQDQKAALVVLMEAFSPGAVGQVVPAAQGSGGRL